MKNFVLGFDFYFMGQIKKAIEVTSLLNAYNMWEMLTGHGTSISDCFEGQNYFNEKADWQSIILNQSGK